MKRLALLSIATTLVACEPSVAPAPTQTEPAETEPAETEPAETEPAKAGTLTWAIGPTTRDITLSRVENRLIDGVLHVKAWGDRPIATPDGRMAVPVVLSGTIPVTNELTAEDAQGGHGLIATIPNVETGQGEPIPMAKMVAKDVPGVETTWVCRTEARREVICNDVHVMPWLSDREPPRAAFKAFFGFN